MKSKIAILTYQGIGNSINALPSILSSLTNHNEVHLFVMGNGSSKFFSDFNIENLFIWEKQSIKEIISASEIQFDSAYALCPTGKKELLGLILTKSKKRFAILNNNNIFYKIIATIAGVTVIKHDVEQHDILNNKKMLPLDLPETSAQMMKLLGIETVNQENIISFHPTASSICKYYPQQIWIQLINHFQAKNFQIKIFSGNQPHELLFIKELQENICSPNVHFLVNTDFKTVAHTIANSSLFIGTDSSLAHLAALLGVKVISLWSFANFRRIYPLSKETHIYLPKETLHSKRFNYTQKQPQYIKRASACEILKIVNTLSFSYNNTSPQKNLRLHVF